MPRWEWRTFGDSFGEADRRFASLSPERVQESDDVYLLARESDASVKVRDGLMDVKQLERVNDDGLEQWKPVMKDACPLSATDVAAVVEALGTAVPSLARGEYTLDEFVAEVIDPSDDLVAVEVQKRREHYTVGGCTAELSEVRTAQRSRRTIAVESEDAVHVIAAVRELGLSSRRNVNMARGLKALAGFGARRYAVVDVGTNSVKFHVGERAADGRHEVEQCEQLGDVVAVAPVSVQASGSPPASTSRWYLLPQRPRSTGLGPVFAQSIRGLGREGERRPALDCRRQPVTLANPDGDDQTRLS